MEPKSQGGNLKGGGRTPRVAVGVEDQRPPEHHMIPVWFFVGLILFIYGLMITATGIYEFSHPPTTVLANLHPALWWGAILTIIGGAYVYFFMPGKP